MSKQRRDNYMSIAREYAQTGRFAKAKKFLDKAESEYPITEMQWWLVKRIIGSEKFRELGFDHRVI